MGSVDLILPPYGYDTNPNVRSTKVGVKPTHRIMCKELNHEKQLNFMMFVSKKDGCLSLEPPFDYIAAKNTENIMEYLKAENMDFIVVPKE